MKISVFGLGYVGTVTAACLARDGHEVTGVDLNPEKVRLVRDGRSPVAEAGLAELLAEGVASHRIRATSNADDAVRATELSLICVGTPPAEDGGPDLSHVFGVCKQIAEALRRQPRSHIVVLRSTVPPATLRRCRQLLSEAAPETTWHLAFNPEFLREGEALRDYDTPPYTLIGTEDTAAETALREIYAPVAKRTGAPIIVVRPEVAEMVKYVANAWHAAKIAFANEIGSVAKACGVDGRAVMELIVKDTKLNVSPAYMRPGFAYGGSCLPKDLAALIHCARERDVPVPVLESIPMSNSLMIEQALEAVLRSGARRVGVLGLAFKPGTDDLRESPAVRLVRRLLDEGCEVRIYDGAVRPARLSGANLAYIRRSMPQFERLLVPEAGEALATMLADWAELVVVTHAAGEFRAALSALPEGARVLDLAGLYEEPPHQERPGQERPGPSGLSGGVNYSGLIR